MHRSSAKPLARKLSEKIVSWTCGATFVERRVLLASPQLMIASVGYQLIDLRSPIAVAKGCDMYEDLFSTRTRRDRSKSLLVVPTRHFSLSAHIVCLIGLMFADNQRAAHCSR
jgi:hypothetical protein